ncbi:serine hydrolase [Ancylobacter sp. MQZ15Z-1]|uniref:Serine hydrolase n=1 Tax=Ancylobacter mangrovi TaxID=2972472 RepID=A0A9X2PDC5_9HYPH|nr:serine hydrolase [Ancylobacter mangrovi]MCS0494806.1 serine hydrolase [Ancylobacter mangrovi]
MAGAPVPARAQTAAPDVIPLDLGPIPPDDVVPMAKGGVEKALAALPDMVGDIMGRSGVPGAAVAVVQGGRTVFLRGFGVRELGKPDPVDADTVFQIASLSKPIAGTVAAIEVTKGVVSWDDKVVKYLPAFSLASPYVTQNATIGDFYAHRTGLPLAAGDDLEDIGFDRAAILARLHLLPLDAFRISYHYANFGITTGAEAVARAAGRSWEDLADEALFAPLGMASTSYRHADFLKRANRATLHALVGGRFQPLYTRDADAQAPAGGVSSSASDLARWLTLLLARGSHNGEQMIAEAALLPAMSPQAFSGPGHALDTRSSFYGFGFGVGVNANGRTTASHSGAFTLGAATNVQILPSANLAIVVLTNAGPVGAAEAIAGQFMDIAQYGVATRDWFALLNPRLLHYYEPVGDLAGKSPQADAAPARALEDYVGTYQNAYFGRAEIVKQGDGLVFHVGPVNFALPMTHWDGDAFSLAPRTENAPDGSLSSLRFVVKDGKAVSFTVDYLDTNGLATWTR